MHVGDGFVPDVLFLRHYRDVAPTNLTRACDEGGETLPDRILGATPAARRGSGRGLVGRRSLVAARNVDVDAPSHGTTGGIVPLAVVDAAVAASSKTGESRHGGVCVSGLCGVGVWVGTEAPLVSCITECRIRCQPFSKGPGTKGNDRSTSRASSYHFAATEGSMAEDGNDEDEGDEGSLVLVTARTSG